MSKTKVTITGLDEIQANINKMVKGIKGRTTAGVIAAAVEVEKNTQPHVPILTGKLKASLSVRWGDGPSGPYSQVVSDADYSLAVHELNIPYLQMGFTETPIVEIITARARI